MNGVALQRDVSGNRRSHAVMVADDEPTLRLDPAGDSEPTTPRRQGLRALEDDHDECGFVQGSGR